MRSIFALGLCFVGCASSDAESAPFDEAQRPPPAPSLPTAPSPPSAAPPSAAAAPDCPAEKTCVALAASDPEARVAEVFATARPGTVILLGAGTFMPTNTLALAADDVVVRGTGRDTTVLDFRGQKAGSEGVLAENAKGLVLESFSVVDTRGNGVKALDGNSVTLRDLAVRWTSEDASSHGAYGLYPVRSRRVLVEDCVVSGASDAGIYLGQSEGAVIRRNVASGNVAGIEIENSFHVDVHDNEARANAQGILVVDLPWVPLVGGRVIRVHHNVITENAAVNFSPKGSFVGALPRGIGVMVMATDDVELYSNTIRDNPTVNALVASFLLTGNDAPKSPFDPSPSRVFIHDNTFGGGGDAPDETKVVGAVLAPSRNAFPAGVVPSIVYDGIRAASKGGGPNPHAVCIRANGTATFADLHSDERGDATFDLAPYDCALPPLAPETLEP